MWDVVVVGLGGIGSFALRSLAKRRLNNNNPNNLKILGLERFTINHTNGSSHGKTRIYRHAYFEHVNYVPLLLYSSNEFRSLEQGEAAGDGGNRRNVITECGNLVIDSVKKKGDGDNTDMIKDGLVAACQKSAKQHNIPVEYMTSSELRYKYPQFMFQDNDVGLLEPGGGFVRPEKAIRAALDDAIQWGAQIKEHICVSSIQEVEGKEGEGHVILHIDGGDDIITKKVIVSGGAWMGKLIPQWSKYLHVTRQVQAWIDIGNDTSYQPDQLPTWIRSDNDNGVNTYGLPADPMSDEPRWIKVAIHGRNDIVHDVDESIPRPDVTKDELEELQLAAQDFLRPVADATSTSDIDKQHDEKSASVSSPFVQAKSCLYTNSPDGHFIVGKPTKNHQHVYGAAGLSGHGFKMTPALGKVLCDLALEDGTTDLPIDFLSPDRFDA